MRPFLDVMVDIDDVLFPWADTIHELARERGLHDLETYTSWHMWEDYECTKEVWLDVVADAALSGMYEVTPPMPGAIEALRRLDFEGVANIHLVTARGFPLGGDDKSHHDVRDWTDTWIHEYAVPHKTLSFAKDKVAIQEDLGVRFNFAIDDGPHNFEALHAAGIDVRLLDRPHNQSFEVSLERVYTVDEFVDIVLHEANEIQIEEYAARAM